MSENIGKLYSEIKSGIAAMQKKNDDLAKGHKDLKSDYDGLKSSEIKSLQEKVTDLMDKAQKAERRESQLKKIVDSLQSDLAKAPIGQNEKNEIVDEYKSALRLYARKGVEIDESLINNYNKHLVDKFHSHEKDASKDQLVKSLNVQSDPDGGYLVLPERIQNFKVERNFETSPVRIVANVINTSNESVEITIDDNESASGGWVSETESRNDTETPKIGKLTIQTHEQYAQPMATQKLLDDASIDIESWLSNKTQDILIRTENTAFVNGNGSGKPKGFLSYDAWASAGSYERGKLEYVNSGTSGQVVPDTIKNNLVSSLKEIYQPNAVFMMKRATFGNIAILKGDGNYLLNPNSFKEGDTKILLGKPVYFADDMNAIGANAKAIAYGDFGMGYTIVDRIGIRVLRDPYTNKPFVKFYTTKRVGGAVTNYEALKIYQLSA